MSLTHPAMSAASIRLNPDEVWWPFVTTIVVTFLTSFVVLPGPPIIRIVPTAFFLLLGVLRTPHTRVGKVRLDPMLVVLIVWSIASIAWTVDRGQTIQQIFREYSRVLAVTIAVGILGKERTLRTLRGLFKVAIVAVFLYWAWKPAASTLPIDGDSEMGLRTFFGHKNTLAKVSLLAILFFMADVKLGKRRFLWVGAAFVLLRFTTATTALLGALAGIGVYWVIITSERLDRRGRTSMRALTLLAGVFIVLASLGTSFSTLVGVTGKDTTLTGRTEIWEVTLPFVRAELAKGYGFGAVWESKTGPGPEINRQVGDFPVVDAHNTYLEQLLQVGAVGSLMVMAWAIATARRAFLALSSSPHQSGWVLGSTTALTVLGVSDAVFIGWLSWFALLSAASYLLKETVPNRLEIRKTSARR